jgi:hypothetical protein
VKSLAEALACATSARLRSTGDGWAEVLADYPIGGDTLTHRERFAVLACEVSVIVDALLGRQTVASTMHYASFRIVEGVRATENLARLSTLADGFRRP